MRKAEKFTVAMAGILLALWAVVVWVTVATYEINSACQEDESCWDCNTMGNKVCGPLTEGN